MIVISDTTPILSLLKAGKLELLEKLYQTVIIPEAVYSELTSNNDYEEERKTIEKCLFLSVEKVHNVESVRILRNVTGLDAGESESLILYEEKKADLLLIDEHKGRNVAKKMSVEYVGTVGILMHAFDKGILNAEEIQEMLKVMLTCDIRLSRKLCNKVLHYTGSEKYF
ncbi:MAG: DUF3368 domain-containing protein [Blautia sp.]|nr:DUF3368 domain-containing protein [Lachnoclostridium sp.]MCM1211408.1 DUF3368 domain-containing protein [Blautia sp.]